MSSKGQRFPAHPLLPSQAAALLAACGDGWVGSRHRALLTVLYRAGLRCSEALSLDVDDATPAPGGGLVLRVRRPKGYARGTPPREIGLDPKAAEIVRTWLEIRACDTPPLFCTRRGTRLDSSHVRRLVRRLGLRAGLRRRVHPHALRHTFAREMYDEGVGPVELMLALGHANLNTTQKYLRSIGAHEVVKITSARRW